MQEIKEMVLHVLSCHTNRKLLLDPNSPSHQQRMETSYRTPLLDSPPGRAIYAVQLVVSHLVAVLFKEVSAAPLQTLPDSSH